MSNKLKFITVTMLTIALIFGGTLNFSEAASKSTTKIISELKKEVKKLTASNKTKDKEITKLKKEIKEKDSELMGKKRMISRRDVLIDDLTRKNNNLTKENEKLGKNIGKLDREVNESREFKNLYVNSLYYQMRNIFEIQYLENIRYCENDREVCSIDVKVDTKGFYTPRLFEIMTKQEFKEIVIRVYRSSRQYQFKPKNIILEFPDGDMIIPISTEL